MAIFAPSRSSIHARDLVVAGVVLFLLLQNGLPALRALAQDSPGSGSRVALANAFTYQGRLVQDGVPGQGSFDFQFAVYDDPTTGQPLAAGVLSVPGVEVDNGVFTTQLDFGDRVFDGDKRWLEVRVDPERDGSFVSLGRNELTATPYALFATSAPWSGISGIPADIADGDANTTYEAAPPLDLDGTTLGLSVAGCDPGDTWVFDGTGWSCDPNETTFGDITAVNGGPGLLGTTASGDATLQVQFGGTGSSNTVARTDHNHFNAAWSGSSALNALRLQNSGAGNGLDVIANNTAISATGALGVEGSSFDSVGVRGTAATCFLTGRPNPIGVHGCTSGGTSAGVAGNSGVGPNGVGIGVYGSAGSYAPIVPVRAGVYGYANNGGVGAYGLTDSNNSIAVKGRVLSGTTGALSGQFLGAPVQMDSGCIGCTAPSDLRLKRDIAPSHYGLDAIRDLAPVSFVYTPETYGDDVHLGFIAQDVREVVPEVVHQSDDGYLQVDYNGLIPVLVNAIQEQQAQIDTLTSGRTAASTGASAAASAPAATGGLAIAVGLPMLAVVGLSLRRRRVGGW